MKKNTQITGNIGLYFVCYKLSLMGWNAMPTARNARGVDIIAYNFDCSKLISLQVKTLSERNPVPLGNTLNKIMGDYWIIVNNVTNEAKSFILYPKEVIENAHKGEKNGKISYWLQTKAYDIDKFAEAWDRIGKA
ncbi:hypothetical protein HY745_15385 [Candidatus Desantisbacteria bacterium]|nr:hypothetical protein [Candidatus Desantisbacteria bacterium]